MAGLGVRLCDHIYAGEGGWVVLIVDLLSREREAGRPVTWYPVEDCTGWGGGGNFISTYVTVLESKNKSKSVNAADQLNNSGFRIRYGKMYVGGGMPGDAYLEFFTILFGEFSAKCSQGQGMGAGHGGRYFQLTYLLTGGGGRRGFWGRGGGWRVGECIFIYMMMGNTSPFAFIDMHPTQSSINTE